MASGFVNLFSRLYNFVYK